MPLLIDHTLLTDIELTEGFQSGDQRCLGVLIDRYRRFARSKARTFYVAGGDADDVEQEALIGLYKAARDFRPEHLASFRSFAELCITRQIITAIKTATRQKHRPLNQYLSVSTVQSTGDGGDQPLEELLPSDVDTDPLDSILLRERLKAMRETMAARLSSFEVEVLRLYVDGSTYEQIAEHLGRHAKSVDNALQRVKRKLGEYLGDETEADNAAAARELAVA